MTAANLASALRCVAVRFRSLARFAECGNRCDGIDQINIPHVNGGRESACMKRRHKLYNFILLNCRHEHTNGTEIATSGGGSVTGIVAVTICNIKIAEITFELTLCVLCMLVVLAACSRDARRNLFQRCYTSKLRGRTHPAQHRADAVASMLRGLLIALKQTLLIRPDTSKLSSGRMRKSCSSSLSSSASSFASAINGSLRFEANIAKPAMPVVEVLREAAKLRNLTTSHFSASSFANLLSCLVVHCYRCCHRPNSPPRLRT